MSSTRGPRAASILTVMVTLAILPVTLVWEPSPWYTTPAVQPTATPTQADPEPPFGDAMIPPDIDLSTFSVSSLPHIVGITHFEINIVESDGRNEPSTENWGDRAQDTAQQVITGLKWWEDMANALYGAELVKFTYSVNIVHTGYEPIRHSWEFQCYWIDQIMVEEYAIDPSLSCFSKVRERNHQLVSQPGVDQAFSVFVVDSFNDADGRFEIDSQGYRRFAYAYVGGPFSVGTYDMGSWGYSRLSWIVAHEIGHIFSAFDQYHPSECDRERGYLAGGPWPQSAKNVDGTVDPGCRKPKPEPGVMAMTGNFFQEHLISPSSLCQVGPCDWGSVGKNGQLAEVADGFPDLLGLPLVLVGPLPEGSTSFSGQTDIFAWSVDGGTESLDNHIEAVTLTKSGQNIGQFSQLDYSADRRHVDFTVIGLNPQDQGMKLCMEFEAGPLVCKIIRPHQNFLPVVLLSR
jgi:hypothetical protein